MTLSDQILEHTIRRIEAVLRSSDDPFVLVRNLTALAELAEDDPRVTDRLEMHLATFREHPIPAVAKRARWLTQHGARHAQPQQAG